MPYNIWILVIYRLYTTITYKQIRVFRITLMLKCNIYSYWEMGKFAQITSQKIRHDMK